jgi:hypothetical protein
MTPLTFRCPKTGKAIDSGIEIDEDSIPTVLTTAVMVACPHCGECHEIPVSEAVADKAA